MSKRKRKRMAKRQMSRSRKGNGKRGKGCGSIFAVVLRPRKSRRVRGAGKSAHPSSRTRVENSRSRPPPRTNPWGTYLYKPALVLPLERRGRPWGATIDLSEVLGSSMSAANRASGPPCSIEQVRDQVGGLDPAFPRTARSPGRGDRWRPPSAHARLTHRQPSRARWPHEERPGERRGHAKPTPNIFGVGLCCPHGSRGAPHPPPAGAFCSQSAGGRAPRKERKRNGRCSKRPSETSGGGPAWREPGSAGTGEVSLSGIS